MNKPRILIFSHDGRGLGHLRRLARLGRVLQRDASVLFIGGHREASWLVPPECEYIHIPHRESLELRRSKQWGRVPFLPEESSIGTQLRREIIKTTVEYFKPDAMITDYLALGVDEELRDVIAESPGTRKYFVSRGMLGDPQQIYQDVLTPSARAALVEHYDRILVMSDRKIVDMAREYSLDARIAEKLVYVGYAAERVPLSLMDDTRSARGLKQEDKWVVCAAGGGKQGEDLILRCWEIAQIFPELYFDIVLGPRSRLTFATGHPTDSTRVNLIQSENRRMPAMHAAADVVIARGGYNSLIEAFVGRASIVVAPIMTEYEQIHHARRLSAYREIQVVDSLRDLDLALEIALSSPHRTFDLSNKIDLDGLEVGAKIILSDLQSGVQSPMEQRSTDLEGVYSNG